MPGGGGVGMTSCLINKIDLKKHSIVWPAAGGNLKYSPLRMIKMTKREMAGMRFDRLYYFPPIRASLQFLASHSVFYKRESESSQDWEGHYRHEKKKNPDEMLCMLKIKILGESKF